MKQSIAVGSLIFLPLIGFCDETANKKMTQGPDGRAVVNQSGAEAAHQNLSKQFDQGGTQSGQQGVSVPETKSQDSPLYVPERKFQNPAPAKGTVSPEKSGGGIWDMLAAPFNLLFGTKLWLAPVIGALIGAAFGGLGGAAVGAVIGLGVGILFMALKELLS